MIMVGIGFTLGVVFGLLLQLPIDNTLPTDSTQQQNQPLFNTSAFRSRRSLSQAEDKVQQELQNLPFPGGKLQDDINKVISLSKPTTNKGPFLLEKQISALVNSRLSPERDGSGSNKKQSHGLLEALRQSGATVNGKKSNSESVSFAQSEGYEGTSHYNKSNSVNSESQSFFNKENSSHDQMVKSMNISKHPVVLSDRIHFQNDAIVDKEHIKTLKFHKSNLHEDNAFISDIVKGIFWSHQLERSCPNPFPASESDTWRRRADILDVVKIEEGCGRMQNRLVTFRDASKACARYRLNTDQIQGDIFSYYLARVLNVSNIPPTILARVDALSSKWRTVHLQLSLAQWADSKLVVLTQYINGLMPAHIPSEFREEGRRLEPTLASLGSKSTSELCELVQWSDLIVLDYLTANLDRVINNMFNRQWNDQMMSNPAHNLEQKADGSLVFLDNESGLFHGYRLLDKYSAFHRTLLQSLCVFRSSTAETIKRLHQSSSIGDELHSLFTSSEAFHKYLPAIPEKNLKILQQRLGDVNQQILHCERLFNR